MNVPAGIEHPQVAKAVAHHDDLERQRNAARAAFNSAK